MLRADIFGHVIRTTNFLLVLYCCVAYNLIKNSTAKPPTATPRTKGHFIPTQNRTHTRAQKRWRPPTIKARTAPVACDQLPPYANKGCSQDTAITSYTHSNSGERTQREPIQLLRFVARATPAAGAVRVKQNQSTAPTSYSRAIANDCARSAALPFVHYIRAARRCDQPQRRARVFLFYIHDVKSLGFSDYIYIYIQTVRHVVRDGPRRLCVATSFPSRLTCYHI